MSNEILIDVRPMVARERHPAIFGAWNKLPAGGAILLVNDHEPLPLFYQFACEHTGTFRWEYLEQGPAAWKVRLTKGDFANPGYAPPARMATKKAKTDAPTVVDVRPIFERGETPCAIIEDAAAETPAGGSFVLLAPFEPVPLYTKLARDGFTHQSKFQPDGSWRIEFSKAKA
jgi:uncharacterized protein (DUF2249 family)